MKRVAQLIMAMRQRLFGIAVALLLLLCFAIGGIWCYTGHNDPETPILLCDTAGVVFKPDGMVVAYVIRPAEVTLMPYDQVPHGLSFGLLGLRFQRRVSIDDHAGIEAVWAESEYAVTLPYWLAMLVMLVLPAFSLQTWWRGRQAKQRLALGLCPTCGYDLWESKERCPECGTPAPTSGSPMGSAEPAGKP